jgi:hypothetical protein
VRGPRFLNAAQSARKARGEGTMETKWTDGSWFVEHGSLWVLSDDPRATIIAEVSGAPSNPQALADARLIAAAPDLYEALASIVRKIDLLGPVTAPSMNAARTALAKARGEV